MAAKSQPSFSPGRRWKIGFDVLLRTALVLAVALMINYLGAKFFGRFYLSSQTPQLSTRTLSILRSITNRVNVVLYYDTKDDENFYPTISALLNEYHSANPNIVIKTVDYVRDAGEAQKVKEQYKLSSATDKDLVIFDCAGRVKTVAGDALYQKKLEQIPSKDPNEKYTFRKKPLAFNGEVMFTATLLAVENSKPFKAYFLQGDGEPSLSDSGEAAYQKFGATLAENFIATMPLNLLGDSAIPDDCNLLIIAGPRSEFPEPELQKIDQYLKQGGRLFVLFNYFSLKHPTGLEPILQQWGVNVISDTVQEHDPKQTGGEDIIIYNFGAHPAVNPLNGLAVQLILPRPVGAVDRQNPPADAPKVTELVFSSTQSTLASDPTAPSRSYPLMVAVEQKAVPGVASTRGTTRIMVIGDSFFLGNKYIESAANRDFAGYAANWLMDRTVLLEGIGPRPVTEFRLTMTRAQQNEVRWLLLGALPGGVLVLGCLVWFVRRK